ncbi:MAG: S8 family serine peptidase [Lachnospiraceae bacterium]|nr:S8 family serine peptidase [Lachnospiraceae bacterium]MDE6252337.1 S8 family serine peptidase [Lachnospiraceae bacterium]
MNYDVLHNYSTGETQTIAFIDSGISDFQLSRINKNCSFVKDVSEYDTNGHGTMMCSIILGYDDIVGIAPHVKLNSYKVVGSSGKIEPEILSEAIHMAVQDNVTIINISLGSYFDNEFVKDAIIKAYDSGITVVASTGDYETGDMLFPAFETLK